jgi:hypothetical protein
LNQLEGREGGAGAPEKMSTTGFGFRKWVEEARMRGEAFFIVAREKTGRRATATALSPWGYSTVGAVLPLLVWSLPAASGWFGWEEAHAGGLGPLRNRVRKWTEMLGRLRNAPEAEGVMQQASERVLEVKTIHF